MTPSSLSVAFLDVGQGDSTVIVLPPSDTGISAIVVDCPADSSVARDYLAQSAVTYMPLVVISHSDHDHAGGMGNLLADFVAAGNRVGCLAYNYDSSAIATGKLRKAVLRHLLQIVRRSGVQTCSPLCGAVWNPAEGVMVEVLHPADEDLKEAQLTEAANEVSVLLRVSYCNLRVLLPGDLGGRGWRWVTGRFTDLRANVIRYPHHGAWYNPAQSQPSLRDILAQIDPEVVVFSVGSGNKHGHPHDNSISLVRSMPKIRFAHTQSTPQCYSDRVSTPWPRQISERGTVEVVMDSSGYKLFVIDRAGVRTLV